MSRVSRILVMALIAVAVASPALAWEFTLRGEYELRTQYFSRTGTSDLFGVTTLQEAPAGPGTYIGFAGPSYYNNTDVVVAAANNGASVSIVRGGFSKWGCDALFHDSRLTLYPTFRINPAVKVYGVYNIGGYRNKYSMAHADEDGMGVPPFERYYMSQTSMNAFDTAAVGSWEQFAIVMNTPMATFSGGVRDFPFGTGATLGYNTRNEQFMACVPYGPFKFQLGIWLARGALLTEHEGWNTRPDKGTKRGHLYTALLSYENGPMDVGAGTIYGKYHADCQEVLKAVLVDTGDGFGLDENMWINMLYFKFSNGRFFANAEYAWLNIDRYRPAPPVAPAYATQRYLEGCHAFGEVGFFSGPAKVAAMCAWVPGRQRANDAAGRSTPNPTKVYVPFPLNYSAVEGYNFLMFNTYGGGNPNIYGTSGRHSDSFSSFLSSDGTGMMADVWSLAARIDYAVAANLNVWGTYIWATRIEKDGYLAGSATSALPGDLPGGGTAFITQNGGTCPFAGNRFIGWEANIGVDWKLLEGLTMSWRYAYWQPGEWFDFAYQAATLAHPTGGGVLLGRDAIHAVRGSFVANF